MIRPPAALLDRLGTSRLIPSRAQPNVGVGERRSRLKGAGMEFIDHRPYQAGDDTRHLDAHVMARTGEAMIRQYAQMRQLSVTVLLDQSGSMGPAKGPKLAAARQMAQLFGWVALSAGDRAQVLSVGGGGAHLSPRWQGGARADLLFSWINDQPTGGPGDIAGALRDLAGTLNARGLIVVVSDWWDEGLPAALSAAEAAGQEVLGMQILTAAEADPAAIGKGMVSLADAETGEEVEVRLDSGVIARYREALTGWQERLLSECRRRQWHFLSVAAEADLADLFLRDLRARGILS